MGRALSRDPRKVKETFVLGRNMLSRLIDEKMLNFFQRPNSNFDNLTPVDDLLL
jgi:hypothetical protein